MKKAYEFKNVYIGVVGPEHEIGECRDSIEHIQRRPGDLGPVFIRATKGYEARETHMQEFLARTQYDGILLLDHDQVFPPETLERLRSHGVPYVSGYYLRRRYQPILPVWFEYGTKGVFPMLPMTRDPERGKLTPLGASGWGCVLIHREVVEAVRDRLKGEPLIIEDDMDVYPYDLARIMGALKGLQALVDEKPGSSTLQPALEAHVKTLREEIRPLRTLKDTVGSDIRFPFYAREAGYTLMGDPDLQIGHILNYNLLPADYSELGPGFIQDLGKQAARHVQAERRLIQERRKELSV